MESASVPEPGATAAPSASPPFLGLATPGYLGGPIAGHEAAIAELGERQMNIAKSRSVRQGGDLQLQTPKKLLQISDRPMLIGPAER